MTCACSCLRAHSTHGAPHRHMLEKTYARVHHAKPVHAPSDIGDLCGWTAPGGGGGGGYPAAMHFGPASEWSTAPALPGPVMLAHPPTGVEQALTAYAAEIGPSGLDMDAPQPLGVPGIAQPPAVPDLPLAPSAPVPEPATWAMLAIGAAAIAVTRWRRAAGRPVA